MSDLPRNAIAAALRAGFPSRPEGELPPLLARQFGVSEDLVRAAINEVWPADSHAAIETPAPFLLIYLHQHPRPGDHLMPECHVRFAEWDGHVTVRCRVEGLDPLSNETPRINSNAPGSGHWIFHQPISLTQDGCTCQTGEYLLSFECEFQGGTSFETSWIGWVKFRVHDDRDNQVLEVESEGHGKINLNGVNLKQFTTVRFKAGDRGCLNFQHCVDELSQAAAASADTSSQTSVVPVQLRAVERPSFGRPVTVARLDLPGDRRIQLYAQNELIFGRNRARINGPNRTDVGLIILPRNASNDHVSEKIARRHLGLRVLKKGAELFDPRSSEQQSGRPAMLNNRPLSLAAVPLRPGHPLQYRSTLGSDEQVGLKLVPFEESDLLHDFQLVLQRIPRRRPNDAPWLRELSELDALLIERSGMSDSFDGREAYLMLMGIVLIGSADSCAIHITGPGVEREHAALCHWDGQFRLMPLDRCQMTCDGSRVPPGQFITLRPEPGHKLQFGTVEISFAPWDQIGFEANVVG